jgi:hypothetical protein
LKIDTSPLLPTLPTTRLATDRPATRFRLDAAGRSVAVGQTVKNEGAVTFVAVTFSTTASTPVAGTPPRPDTRRSNAEPATTGIPGRP